MSGARIVLIVAFDVAREIDLAGAALALGAATVPDGVRAVADPVETRVPAALAAPPELADTLSDRIAAESAATVRIYEFGAIAWRAVFDVAPGADLAAVIAALRADSRITDAARIAVDAVVARLGRAVRDAAPWSETERYDVTVIDSLPADDPAGRAALCRILRPGVATGTAAPSDDEIADALRHRASRSAAEAVVVDVAGALVVAPEPGPLLDLFEFVTVQLLEMRFLDARLDEGLRKSYDVLAAPPARLHLPGGPAAGALERVGSSRIDAVLLFQHVRNAPKLVAGPWLVRVYEAAAARRRLPQWHESVLHKLDTLGTLYERLRDRAATARAETLEWIVIILIALSMALPVLV